MPTLALLVSTYNAPDALELTLRSVLAQSLLPDEVLVADDGSGPETLLRIEGLTAEFGARGIALHHLWQEDRGYRLSAVRNRALAAASAAYVVQIDGDVILHPHFLREHRSHARPGFLICGRRANLTPECTREILTRMRIPARFRARDLERHPYALYAPLLTPVFLRQYAHSATKGVMGSNLSYWLEDALRVNGYDEAFEGWGKEDNDFVLRLLNLGVRRRTVVGAALQYHLHHPERDRSRLGENAERFQRMRGEARSWCPDGIVKAPAR